jgi:hypothetical protein
VVGEFSARRVLTTTLADGMTWSEAVRQAQDLRNAWGEAIYRFAWGSLCRFRMAYADPHPGNYRFHADGSIAILDFGCVKRYPEQQAAKAAGLFWPTGPSEAGAEPMTVSPDLFFLARMDAGVADVLSALRATGPWAAIRTELNGERPPSTRLGRLDAGFRSPAASLKPAS